MYKVGDEVWVKGKIVAVEGISTKFYNIEVLDSLHNTVCVSTNCVTDKTYEMGLNDAWTLLKKIYDMNCDAIEEIFGVKGGFYEVIRNFTYEDCREKIESYEKEKSVRVGDVVECNGFKGVVLHIFHSGSLNIVYENGIIETLASVQECKKTGKHIEIESLLKQIGE